jgi:NAD+ kinase
MIKTPARYDKIAFVASAHEDAEAARRELSARYGHVAPEQADIVVALGGDGMMLQTLHERRDSGVPIYGMNRGSVGFLMNHRRTYDPRGALPPALSRSRNRSQSIGLDPQRAFDIEIFAARNLG